MALPRPVLSRWWARYLAADLAGLAPQSRRPRHSPTQHGPAVIESIDWARDFGWGVGRIADEVGVGHGTVQRALVRSGRNNRLPRAPRRKVRRYEKTAPGELLHLDLKYLPQLGHRPEFEYAAIDDFSREGAAHIAGERSTIAATRFLEYVLAQLPYRVDAVMTDNDMMFTMRYAFHSNRLTRFEQALKSVGIEHRLIRPRSPASNGKWSGSFKRSMTSVTGLHNPAVASARRCLETVSGVLQSRAPSSKPGWREPRHAAGRLSSPSPGVTSVLVLHKPL